MKDQPKSEAMGFEGHIPGKRCKMNGDEIYICHIIEGNEALDYEGKCYGCGAKRAITFDEDNQTEADAARAYLIKEGLDPDQLVKEGLVFIKAIQDLIIAQEEITRLKAELERKNDAFRDGWIAKHKSLTEELEKERELRSELWAAMANARYLLSHTSTDDLSWIDNLLKKSLIEKAKDL